MHFCANCGNRVEDNVPACPNCGAPQGVQQAQHTQQQYQQYQQAPQPQYQAATQVPPRFSDWDGGVLDTIVNSIIASIIMSLTCGIATPWAICYMMKFVISHAIIDGRRLTFTGTGGSLFAQWIKWFLLTIITCGIYGFWVYPKLYKWVCSNIHYQ